MKATARTGDIELDGAIVTVRKLSIGGMPNGIRTVRVADLIGVDFRHAQMFEEGHLKLVYPNSSSGFIARSKTLDPDCVSFDQSEQDAFVAIYGTLMSTISGQEFTPPPIAEDPAKEIKAAFVLIAVLAALAWILFVVFGDG